MAKSHIDENALFERDDFVLATLTPSGILLHHMPSGGYLQLGAAGKIIWELCDSTYSVGEIALRPWGTAHSPIGISHARRVIGLLLRGGFIQLVQSQDV